MSKFGGSIVAAALVLGILSGPAHAVPCRNASTTVDTFYIETEWNKKVYKPGETVKVTVTVSRPAEEDPLGNGIPMPSERVPAEDVQVTTAFAINPPYWPFGGDTTDAAGQVHLKIKLPKNAPEGKVQTTTMAKKVHNANGPACTELTEQSTKFEEPFEVKRGG